MSDFEQCQRCGGVWWPQHNHLQPVKCDLCGSTAIDHTEMDCQLNRVLQKTTPAGQKRKATKKI